MKTINNIFLATVLSTISVILFSSCDESGDTTPPSINLISPANGDKIQIGKVIHFEAEFSDNEMLKSYKIEIHNNIENPHNHILALYSTEQDTEMKFFSYNEAWDISDKRNTTPHIHIDIPSGTIAGEYHLIVYCWDAAGNESYIPCKIILTNEEIEDEQSH